MSDKANLIKAILIVITGLTYFIGGYFIGQSWAPGAAIGIGLALMLLGLVGVLLIFQVSEAEDEESNLVVILALVWLVLGLCNVTVILFILEIF